MKKQALFEDAERAYVGGDQSYDEVAAKLGVAEKTLRIWGKEGNWSEKRAKFHAKRDSLDAKLYEFTDELMTSVLKDWREGQQVDPGRLYALTRLIDKLEKARSFEAQTKADQKEAAAGPRAEGLSEEVLKKIEAQIKMM